MSDVYITKGQLAGKKVELSDISIRDGLQSLETIIDTDTKVKYLEGLIIAGFKRMEATNYGHPKFVPFFPDATEVLKRLLNSETKTPYGKTIGEMMKRNGGDVELTAVTIHERSAERAFKDFDEGHGPDRACRGSGHGRRRRARVPRSLRRKPVSCISGKAQGDPQTFLDAFP